MDSQETTVVRFNGGSQSGHGVVTPDGQYHIFAQFASATLVPGVQTFLSRFMLIDPWRMLVEEEHLQGLGITDALERTRISENALLITPFHAAANRLRERARGDARHGSCGLGIGETMWDMVEEREGLVLRARDLRDLDALRAKLRMAQHAKSEQLYAEGVLMTCWQILEAKADINELLDSNMIEVFIEMLRPFVERLQIVSDDWLNDVLTHARRVWMLTDLSYGDQGKGTTVDFLGRECQGSVIFEPSQGVLLDEWRGFHPYTTWSTCTFDNAHTLLREAGYEGPVTRLGILRAYATRHGAGPFVTEDASLSERLPDPPSARGEWQGAFRVGHFDAVSARYAIDCCGGPEVFDGLVITCLDRLMDEEELRLCTSYDLTRVEGEQTGFFSDFDGMQARRMELGPFKDLEHQQALTDRLEQTTPVYATSVVDEDDPEVSLYLFLAHIAQELRLPIAITSWGPTAEDKRWERTGEMLQNPRHCA